MPIRISLESVIMSSKTRFLNPRRRIAYGTRYKLLFIAHCELVVISLILSQPHTQQTVTEERTPFCIKVLPPYDILHLHAFIFSPYSVYIFETLNLVTKANYSVPKALQKTNLFSHRKKWLLPPPELKKEPVEKIHFLRKTCSPPEAFLSRRLRSAKTPAEESGRHDEPCSLASVKARKAPFI